MLRSSAVYVIISSKLEYVLSFPSPCSDVLLQRPYPSSGMGRAGRQFRTEEFLSVCRFRNSPLHQKLSKYRANP